MSNRTACGREEQQIDVIRGSMVKIEATQIEYSKSKTVNGKVIYDLFSKVGWILPRDQKPAKHLKIDGISNHTIYLNPEDDLTILKSSFENSASIYIAKHNSQIVGFVRVISDFHQRSFIYDLVADPDYQRIGIGAKLIEFCVIEFSKTQITLGTSTKTMKFYEKFGFVKSENYLELATEHF